MDESDSALSISTHKSKKKDEHVYTSVPVDDADNSIKQGSTKTKIPIKGVLTLIGGFIVCLSFGSDFSYPNINTYLTSYMRQNGHNDDLGYVKFVYLTSTKMLVQGALMPFLGELARWMGPRLAVATGVIIYSGGYLLTYLAVMHHFVFPIITLSLHGVAFCFVYATTIRTAQAWFSPKRKGLIASIVVSGYGFGSGIWTPLQTKFVNPENIKPLSDAFVNCTNNWNLTELNCTEAGDSKYFVDQSVLDRVPSMFAVLGIIYAAMGFLAVVLISEPNTKYGAEKEKNEENEKKSISVNLTPSEVLKRVWFYQVYILCLANGSF